MNRMLVLMFVWCSLVNVPGQALASERSAVTESGIALDAPWKLAVHAFARDNLVHSAWGLEHSERDYLLALEIARLEELDVDTDVLFAASFLHDVGVYEPYVVEGAEHSATAVSLLETLLLPTGFPENKLPAVKQAILGHMFYAEVELGDNTGDIAARILHDADTLDFLGHIGIARILSITSRHAWAPDLMGAHLTIEKFQTELPDRLLTKAAKRISRQRIKQSKRYLKSVHEQSSDGAAL